MIRLTLEHVRQAEVLFGYSFASLEQEVAFQLMESKDVQAAPGSGKTSLLAAKIALLLREWPSRYRGICVLSHTNTAAREVKIHADKLGASLASPHYVGTVQSFAHRFLALPYLRSKGVSDVRVHDEEYRSRIIQIARWGKFSTLRSWLEHRHLIDSLGDVTYRGAELRVQMPFVLSETSTSYQQVLKIKDQLFQERLFRFSDMYAFALAYMREHPLSVELISHRFPLVFVDEAQDLDDDQTGLLDSVFSSDVVLQRFGDVNQAIFSGRASSLPATCRRFPEADAIGLPMSHRFGDSIASLANRLKCHGPDIVGAKRRCSAQPHAIVFTPETIGRVLPEFGQIITRVNDGKVSPGYVAKAIGARRNGQSLKGDHVPRDIYDYCRGLIPVPDDAHLSRRDELCSRMRLAYRKARLHSLDEGVRIGLEALGLHIRGLEGHPEVRQSTVNGCWDLVVGAANKKGTAVRRALARVLSLHEFPDRDQWPVILADVFALLITDPRGRQRDAIVGAALFSEPQHLPEDVSDPVLRHVSHGVAVEIDTIHNSKGETHDATLLLETYVMKSHDVKLVFSKLLSRPDESLLQRRRRAFVALTRPRQLACMALFEEHVSRKVEKLLRDEMGCVLVRL